MTVLPRLPLDVELLDFMPKMGMKSPSCARKALYASTFSPVSCNTGVREGQVQAENGDQERPAGGGSRLSRLAPDAKKKVKAAGTVERALKTAPPNAVFCHLFTGTETYAVSMRNLTW
jgi:hypothetical protein